MAALTGFTGWVRVWLQDEAGSSFGAVEVEAGLRMALSAYSQISPKVDDRAG